jgi:hypothetical protein
MEIEPIATPERNWAGCGGGERVGFQAVPVFQ